MANLATWFTPSLQTISRSAGRSAIAAAAYRACTKLTDERTGLTHDFTPKAKHGLAENICIGIPNGDIGKLWNNAEKEEKRANSTVARELMVPLPADWSAVERAKCARGMGEMLRARYGVAVLVSIHTPSKDNNNHHAHILFTTRTVNADGVFGEKTRILDSAKFGEVKKMREAVCEIMNTHAQANGSAWFVHAGKFSDIIEDHVPTKHISISHGKRQKEYIDANRNNVEAARNELAKTKAQIKAIDAKIEALQTQPAIAASGQNATLTPAKASEGITVQKPINTPLKRIAMPPAAEKARAQVEKALYLKADKKKQHDEWTAFQSALLANAPKPEYNFFGRPSKHYKMALAEHTEKLKSATEAIEKCDNRAIELNAYIRDPERKRLLGVYRDTLAHNAQVAEHEKQMAQQRAQAQRKQAEQAEHEQAQAQRAIYVHWAANLNAASQGRAANDYNSGGYGL